MGNLHSRIPTRGTSSQPMPVTVVGGSASGTEYKDGQVVPANPTAPSLVYDNSGNWQHVSAANPLPVTGGGGGQQYTSGATVPATQIGSALEWSDGTNWQTASTAKPLPVTIPASSPIAVSLASYQTTIPVSLASVPVPVSGTFFQATQPISLASILVPISLASVPVPVSGTFFQTTQQVSQATLPLPTAIFSGGAQAAVGDTNTDAKSATDGRLFASANLQVFNNTSWDRVRSFAGASGATLSTGIAGSGIIAWNGTNYENITTNSTATANKYGLDSNILSILGTAPTTAGKLDVKGADGDVFVRQGSASLLNAQVQPITGSIFPVSLNSVPVTVPVSGTFFQTTQPVSLASVPVPVSGTFWQATQPISLASIMVPISLASVPVPVSGTFFQTTQPVSLASVPVPVSLASLPVPVSGTFFQVTQPVSLASVPVPVSLASLPVPVSGTFWQTTQSVSLASVPVPVTVGSLPNSALTDATANPTTGVLGSMNEVFNGTTWDRVLSLAAASGATSSTGILGVGNVAWNGTNYENITANSTTTTSKYGLDNNILSILGTAPTSAGYLDVKATAVVSDSDQTYTAGTSNNLTVATTGRLRVENDHANLRLDELNYIQNYITNINTLIASESENSQRAGFEMR